MATYTWIGGTSTNWSDASNWSSSPSSPIAPQIFDDVIFGPNNNPCTITALSTCRTLTIQSGYTSLITLNTDLQVGSSNTSTSNTGITINGTPTFTGSGWLTLMNAGNTTTPKSISSSANVEIYRFKHQAAFGPSSPGTTTHLSGSVIVNNLFFNNPGSVGTIAFTPSTQFILKNKLSETAIVTGSGGLGINSVTPIPTLTISGSVSWETNANVGYNVVIASESIFRLTGSLGPNYQTLGGGLFFNMVSNQSFLSTPLSFDVNANATILCTPFSILQFYGGSSGAGTWRLNMSGSTTNIWNALRLGGGGSPGMASFNISSDVYLAKNTSLSNLNTLFDRIQGSLILSSGTPITTTGGSKIIYVGGNIIPGFSSTNNSIYTTTRFSSGGPKIVMYGTGYISPPPLGTLITNTVSSGVGLHIDFDISSSNGSIIWGSGGTNRIISNTSATSISTFPTWSYITAQNYNTLLSSTNISTGPGVLFNFQNRSIWDLNILGGQSVILSSSLVCSGSLSTINSLNNLNSSSLTNPSFTVLQNIHSTYSIAFPPFPTSLGQLRGNTPIIMTGDLPATYSLLVPINNGKGNDIIIDKPSTQVLISNPLSASGTIPNNITTTPIPLTYDSGTFTYIAGNVNTGISTLSLGNSASLNTAGNSIPWYNITISGSTSTNRGSLINIISPLTITNELNLGVAGNVAFTGSDTWTCSRLICTTPGRRITLQDAISNGQKEYRTTNFVNLSSSNAASPIIMSSSATPTTRASWSVSFNAPNANVFNVSGAYIDSSNGRTIYTTGGTLNTINWNLGTLPTSLFYTFFID